MLPLEKGYWLSGVWSYWVAQQHAEQPSSRT